ncbi:hypothetical protein N431DRAFT_325603 [Stipitochalara longipes BDJ]|nr:hypothetical protein N431DRAFT_325603 [Stipitochalara longipes BDJ]
MDEVDVTVRHYAILIGINFYVAKPLRGCVRDVLEMKKYLDTQQTPVNVQLFTATTTGGSKTGPPTEEPKLWPTYNNIKLGLQDVTSRANAGDFVYIHYSGHGTRMRAPRDLSGTYTGDVGLNLIEGVNGNEIRYFRGMELAHLVKDMVTKGLVVTLVLDCCFSGGVSRYDDDDPDSIRSLSYDAKVDETYPPDLGQSVSHKDDRPVSRDASMLPNWIINPDGYTMLVACGPHEIAREIEVEDRQRRGALSYLLLRALVKLGSSGRAQQEIYHHLSATFREFCQKQNPVLYGNTALRFFGPLMSEVDTRTIPIIKGQISKFYLQAGQAHGVHDSDLFTVYPFYPTDGMSNQTMEYIPQVRVTKAAALTSELEMLNQGPSPSSIRTGWNAKALVQASLQRYPIWLSVNLSDLDQWQAASRKRTSLDIHYADMGKNPFSFHIIMNDLGGYEILDGSNNKVSNLLSTSHGYKRSPDDILLVTEHLIRFKHVRDITNKQLAANFRDSFDVHLINSSGETFEAGKEVEVGSGDTMTLEVRNKGSKTLYLYVYDLGPHWQIQNILRGTYEAIPPQDPARSFSGMTRKKLKMTIPSEMIIKGNKQCEDIIKVFLTTQPTTFASLEMPKIDEVAKADTYQSSLVDISSGSMEASDDWTALNFDIHIRA